ncbi:5-methylcytosine-specific restriction protein A [Rahnella sp. BIGb0236]|uniref:HNH endonuclease n=1 Tax=Rahnella sp. BIGb0236 TaxID=2485117 RepID=UPI00105E1909|nr:HNH endonuclease [Rahnella sp. BIGb0236]TDS98212.1 5-methylcytosine-specific restriction protein A [Rahnella sp. BIGb0236]
MGFKYGKPTVTLVVEAVKSLGGSATQVDVDTYLKKEYPNYKNNTYTNLNACSVNRNSPGSHSFNKYQRRSDDYQNPRNKYDQLFKRGDIYELYKPEIHGVWEIYCDEHSKWHTRIIDDSDEARYLERELEIQIESAEKLALEERKLRLISYEKHPQIRYVMTKVFLRNPYVVVEVLERAKGICEICKLKAPFLRAKDGRPYLEVHHIQPLSEGGMDIVENAQAICPNCHRKAHFGPITS